MQSLCWKKLLSHLLTSSQCSWSYCKTQYYCGSCFNWNHRFSLSNCQSGLCIKFELSSGLIYTLHWKWAKHLKHLHNPLFIQSIIIAISQENKNKYSRLLRTLCKVAWICLVKFHRELCLISNSWGQRKQRHWL